MYTYSELDFFSGNFLVSFDLAVFVNIFRLPLSSPFELYLWNPVFKLKIILPLQSAQPFSFPNPFENINILTCALLVVLSTSFSRSFITMGFIRLGNVLAKLNSQLWKLCLSDFYVVFLHHFGLLYLVCVECDQLVCWGFC